MKKQESSSYNYMDNGEIFFWDSELDFFKVNECSECLEEKCKTRENMVGMVHSSATAVFVKVSLSKWIWCFYQNK